MASSSTATTDVLNSLFMMLMSGLELELPRLGSMLLILMISFFAVSFPSLSKYVKFFRIPHIAFFIGKHFGTGVILSTAFCHLLQDAFEFLQKPLIKKYYHGIGRWTGLIVLGSLLVIFLIEYLSTTYVEHLQAEPSAPPSPIASPPRRPSPSLHSESLDDPQQHPTLHDPSSADTPRPIPTESTPLIASQSTAHKRRNSHPVVITTHDTSLITLPTPEYLTILNSPRVVHANLCEAFAHAHGHQTARQVNSDIESGSQDNLVSDLEAAGARQEQQDIKPKIGRRRQIIGILVLQLGIMIHSLVIGLTLAITSGVDFTSLVTAISFHQLFEGLSLGIRIAALPPSPSLIMTTPSSPKSVFGRTSLKTSSSNDDASSKPWWWPRSRRFNWLKPILSILFAITTPLGMAAGMKLFPHEGRRQSPEAQAEMYLTQGIMNAISAGMLIYAATVEMMAGDFVFGDLGGSHPGHGHSHNHSDIEDLMNQPVQPSPLLEEDRQYNDHHHHPHPDHHGHEYDPHHHHHHHRHHHAKLFIGKRVLALFSLLAGVTLMALIGLNE